MSDRTVFHATGADGTVAHGAGAQGTGAGGDDPGRAARWRDRARRWLVPEVAAGAVIVGVWALVAAVALLGSVPAALAIAGAALWMHFGAVETGNHTLAWMTTGLVLLFVLITLTNLDRDVSPLVFAAASTTALAHSDLIRLSYARRRQGQLDPAVRVSVAVGVAAAGVVAIGGMGLARALASTSDRNWLWMPATAAALLVVAVAFTVFPVRRAPTARRDRWRPGDRLPPPPPPDGSAPDGAAPAPSPVPADGWRSTAGPVA